MSFRNKMDIWSQNLCLKILGRFKNDIALNKSENDEYIVESDNVEVVVYVSVVNGVYLYNGNFQISGNTSVGDGEVKIYISINDVFSEKDLDSFYKRLIKVIRHEIEHHFDILNKKEYVYENGSILEAAESSVTLDERLEKMSEYLLYKSEIIPYIRSIMIDSKKRKVSFINNLTKFLDDYLYGDFDRGRMSQEIVGKVESIKKRIEKIYITEALKIYRNVK